MHRTAATLSLAACTLVLAACAHTENDRLRLGYCEVLPAFQNNPHQLPPAGPSVTGLDRSNWAPVDYVVPVHGTAHMPVYAPPHYELASLARQRGDFPTVESSLELGHPDAGEEVWEAFRLQGWAFLDSLLVVPRLVVRPPTATDWSPRGSYERAPAAAIAAPACHGGGSCCQDDAGGCCAQPGHPDSGD